ncbi:MAG TPA: APC family permease, partial [Dehalococcoidia bacterium]|nr:APC family permease [Dehalococcoidia bacterium]
YVRVSLDEERPFRRTSPTHWEATLAAERPQTVAGRAWAATRRYLFGPPLASSRSLEERLSKVKALAVFSSDALSSSAYATEEILLVLVLAGSGNLGPSLPISLAIVVLLLTVVASYRQAIRAYPQGGGAYSVSRENLGIGAALLAAAALLTDYVLTVAVSISAGVAAVVSAVPDLGDYRVEMAVVFVALLTIVNLRGLRESGTIFAVPTYLFVLAFGAMIVTGAMRLAFGDQAGSLADPAEPAEFVPGSQELTLFLVLRAFSSGAVALTGVEAMANGVQAFKPPEAKNAATTLVWMGAILAFFFVGSAFLANRFGIVPIEDETVISQVGRVAFGGENVFYYVLQGATALILVLAANTAFNGFPILASLLAKDGFMPHQFAFRGDRLAYSYGIVVLAAVAAGLLVAFGADTHRLIPLYAVGVFMAFTLSQFGLVLRWRRVREPGWRGAATINGVGAAATGLVMVIVAVTKFTHGAWFVLVLMPIIVMVLSSIHGHYETVRRELSLDDPAAPPLPPPTLPPDRPVIVPVGEPNRAVMRAVRYARGLTSNAMAVHVVTEEGEDVSGLEERWEELFPDVPLIILESPYRSFQAPFIAFIDRMDIPPNVPLTVVLPEFVPAHWWQNFLHNQTARRLRSALRSRPNTVVVDVPEQLTK